MGNRTLLYYYVILCRDKEAEEKGDWLITKKADGKTFAPFLHYKGFVDNCIERLWDAGEHISS